MPVRNPIVYEPRRGYSTSSALRNALPLDDSSVSDTCFTLVYSGPTTGIRATISSHQLTSFCPMKFCVNNPTTKMKASVSTAPRPGRRKPNRFSGRQACGNSSSVWSIVPMMRPSTHSVMARGTSTSRPVRNTDLSVVFFVVIGFARNPRGRCLARRGRHPFGQQDRLCTAYVLLALPEDFADPLEDPLAAPEEDPPFDPP